MLRMVGVGKRDLRALFQRQQVEDRMDMEEVALREGKALPKQKKKRASLLRASEQCSAVLVALRHIMDDIREDGSEVERHRMEVDSVGGLARDLPLDVDDDVDMEDEDLFDDLFPLDGDLAGSGRYVIPCKPQNTLLEDALSVPVLRRSSGRKKKRKRKRHLESEKALKCNSLPLGFKLKAPKSWEVDSMTVQMDSMRIRNRRAHKRSPSQGSPEAETKRSHLSSAEGEPPSKRKAVSPPTSAGHKPPVDLPRLRLSDLPRDPSKPQYSPDLSKSCNIISPRSAFSRSPRGNTSPIDVRRTLSPVNSAHQRPSMSPSPRIRSPLSSPSWTPRSTARMASMVLAQHSPTTHQNSN